jgi:biopolymer transport protein ExbD
MAMAAKGKAEINVTPMIDVLLVLVIIFMVITPLTPTGLRALVPQPPSPRMEDRPHRREIVLTVSKNGLILINGERVEFSRLPGRLERIFQIRGDDVIFIMGEGDLKFRSIAEVIDVANGVGLRKVALMTDQGTSRD